MDDVKKHDWSTVPQEFRGTAQMIDQYRYPMSPRSMQSGYYRNMFNIINKVDPSFDFQKYQARQKSPDRITPVKAKTVKAFWL